MLQSTDVTHTTCMAMDIDNIGKCLYGTYNLILDNLYFSDKKKTKNVVS